MQHFSQAVFVAAGFRTPFGRGGGALANHDAISLSVPVVKAVAALAEPDWWVAIGHPFGATGARDLSQAVKEPWSHPAGARRRQHLRRWRAGHGDANRAQAAGRQAATR